MSGRRVELISCLVLGLSAFAACGPDERRFTGFVPPHGGAQNDEQFSANEALGGAGSALGGMGGVGFHKPELCGDGIWQPEESCDPTVDGFESCIDLGFDGGETSCSSSCGLDVSRCFDEQPDPVPFCGDGVIAEDEECDDGNIEALDGCSSGCALESSEHEPNDSEEEAEDYIPGTPFFGLVESEGEDWLRVVVEESPAQLLASVSDLSENGCSEEVPGMNPAIELVDAYGDPIAWDGDSGQGECALLEVGALVPGIYYLRITGEMSGAFPYVLDVELW